MTEQPDPLQGRTLTNEQIARLDFARRDLDHARTEDLAQLEKPELILLIERLRSRLDDTMQLAAEITRTGSKALQ
jgi:hypothetical protein